MSSIQLLGIVGALGTLGAASPAIAHEHGGREEGRERRGYARRGEGWGARRDEGWGARRDEGWQRRRDFDGERDRREYRWHELRQQGAWRYGGVPLAIPFHRGY